MSADLEGEHERPLAGLRVVDFSRLVAGLSGAFSVMAALRARAVTARTAR